MTQTFRLTLAAALATLAFSAASGAAKPESKPAPDACAKSAPPDSAAPAPSGTIPAEPAAVITLTGKDLAAAPQASGTLPATCAQATKATKTRSNIQNN